MDEREGGEERVEGEWMKEGGGERVEGERGGERVDESGGESGGREWMGEGGGRGRRSMFVTCINVSAFWISVCDAYEIIAQVIFQQFPGRTHLNWNPHKEIVSHFPEIYSHPIILNPFPTISSHVIIVKVVFQLYSVRTHMSGTLIKKLSFILQIFPVI